jgi:hypothetical protein
MLFCQTAAIRAMTVKTAHELPDGPAVAVVWTGREYGVLRGSEDKRLARRQEKRG